MHRLLSFYVKPRFYYRKFSLLRCHCW